MPLKVLLADDSLTAQNMGKKILTEAGYDVVAVSNGAQALKKIAAELPDLVVLDVYMPGYSGLEVCERIRNSRETARTPIVLSVGKMEAFKAEEVNRVRADGLIVKPFEATELLAVVKKLEEKVSPRPKRRSQAESEAEMMAEPEPAAPEPQLETTHTSFEIPTEMASTPVIGMDLIPEEAPQPPAPLAAAPVEFEVERDPEPVKVEEGPRMATAAGLSGVFEVGPAAHPVDEKPAAPAPVEEFDRFQAGLEASAAPEPAREPAVAADASTREDDCPAPQASGAEAESAGASGPLAETWSASPASPGPLEYAAEGFNHPRSETSESAPPPAPEVLSELLSWDEPATPFPTPESSAGPMPPNSAAPFVAAVPVWVAQEAEIEPDELAVPLHQQMQQAVQISELRESAPPASPAVSAEASLDWEIPAPFPEPAPAAVELPTFRDAATLPEFKPFSHQPVEPSEIEARTEFAPSSPEFPMQPTPAPEAQRSAPPVAEFAPQASAAKVTQTAVDPGRIASIVEQALERLKPELIAAVTRELEKKNQ